MQFVHLLMLDNMSLTQRAFSWINTWVYSSFPSRHYHGNSWDYFLPRGSTVNFPLISIQFALLPFLRSSQHGVSISWLQRLPLRYYLVFTPLCLQLLYSMKLFLSQCLLKSLLLSIVSVTTGWNHIQLLGNSSFEFPPWAPGEFQHYYPELTNTELIVCTVV